MPAIILDGSKSRPRFAPKLVKRSNSLPLTGCVPASPLCSWDTILRQRFMFAVR